MSYDGMIIQQNHSLVKARKYFYYDPINVSFKRCKNFSYLYISQVVTDTNFLIKVFPFITKQQDSASPPIKFKANNITILSTFAVKANAKGPKCLNLFQKMIL